MEKARKTNGRYIYIICAVKERKNKDYPFANYIYGYYKTIKEANKELKKTKKLDVKAISVLFEIPPSVAVTATFFIRNVKTHKAEPREDELYTQNPFTTIVIKPITNRSKE